MKRWIAILLAVVLLMASFTACKDNKECKNCNGTGIVTKKCKMIDSLAYLGGTHGSNCSECHGKGTYEKECGVCDGTGVKSKS